MSKNVVKWLLVIGFVAAVAPITPALASPWQLPQANLPVYMPASPTNGVGSFSPHYRWYPGARYRGPASRPLPGSLAFWPIPVRYGPPARRFMGLGYPGYQGHFAPSPQQLAWAPPFRFGPGMPPMSGYPRPLPPGIAAAPGFGYPGPANPYRYTRAPAIGPRPDYRQQPMAAPLPAPLVYNGYRFRPMPQNARYQPQGLPVRGPRYSFRPIGPVAHRVIAQRQWRPPVAGLYTAPYRFRPDPRFAVRKPAGMAPGSWQQPRHPQFSNPYQVPGKQRPLVWRPLEGDQLTGNDSSYGGFVDR